MRKVSVATLLLCMCLGVGTAQAQSRYVTKKGLFTSNMESPAMDRYGNIYIVNYMEDGTIGRVREDGSHELYVKLPEGSIGNGIRFNRGGDMLIADFKGHNILKIDTLTREVSVYAHNSKMNQPNDLTYSAQSGMVYASDPNWAEGTGQVWLVSPSGESQIVAPDMGTTNGIELSPDGKYLYVNESVQRRVWRFRVMADGTLSDKQQIHQFDDFGMDGMKCDSDGNLYVTRYDKGEIVVLSPEGKLLKSYKTKGKRVSNLCFNADQTKIFATFQDTKALEVIKK